MIKIIGTLAILYVYYCQTNAEIYDLKPPTENGDKRIPNNLRQKQVSTYKTANGIQVRIPKVQLQSAKLPMGDRENKNLTHKDNPHHLTTPIPRGYNVHNNGSDRNKDYRRMHRITNKYNEYNSGQDYGDTKIIQRQHSDIRVNGVHKKHVSERNINKDKKQAKINNVDKYQNEIKITNHYTEKRHTKSIMNIKRTQNDEKNMRDRKQNSINWQLDRPYFENYPDYNYEPEKNNQKSETFDSYIDKHKLGLDFFFNEHPNTDIVPIKSYDDNEIESKNKIDNGAKKMHKKHDKHQSKMNADMNKHHNSFHNKKRTTQYKIKNVYNMIRHRTSTTKKDNSEIDTDLNEELDPEEIFITRKEDANYKIKKHDIKTRFKTVKQIPTYTTKEQKPTINTEFSSADSDSEGTNKNKNGELYWLEKELKKVQDKIEATMDIDKDTNTKQNTHKISGVHKFSSDNTKNQKITDTDNSKILNNNKEKNEGVNDYKYHHQSPSPHHLTTYSPGRENRQINQKQTFIDERNKNKNIHREASTWRTKDVRMSRPTQTIKTHGKPWPVEIPNDVEKLSEHEGNHHRKLKKHKKQKSFLRSTRIIPEALNQQDEQTKSPSTSLSFLSPYAIKQQLQEILEQFPEANATIETLARTVEYNDIIIAKVTHKRRDTSNYFRADTKYIDEMPEKKIIFIVHGLTVMGLTRLPSLTSVNSLKKLLSYYFKYLDKFDFFIMPMANPDGYPMPSNGWPYSYWNKNMSPQEACLGVCVDRNFDVAWNSSRQISSCSQLYPGPSPFSEVESRAVRDVFHYFGHKILAYIHVHAGTFNSGVFKGDAILYPRGYTDMQSDDDKYIDLRGDIEEAMKNASFQVVTVAVDTLYNWYGKVLGSSVDYASTVYGIPYALEFVMQIYDSDYKTDYADAALVAVWGRLIRTTFNNIHRSLRVVDRK